MGLEVVSIKVVVVIVEVVVLGVGSSLKSGESLKFGNLKNKKLLTDEMLDQSRDLRGVREISYRD